MNADLQKVLAHPAVEKTGWSASEIPVFVMFGADWCGFCVKQKPILQALEREYAGRVKFEIIDTDQASELKSAFEVKGIPAMFILAPKAAEILSSFKGLQTRASLKRRLERVLSG